MFSFSIPCQCRRGLLALALSVCAGAAAAQTYHVDIDTSSFGSGGWLDMQFNPGNAGLTAASITLSDFSSGFDNGSVSGLMPQLSGDASGSLAGGYRIGNGGSFNDVFNAVQFGGTISFDVSFSGAAAPSSHVVQSIFSVAAYGADEVTALGTTDAAGNLLTASWTPALVAGQAGAVAFTVIDQADVNVGAVSAVPEEPVWLLLAAGVVVAGLHGRRREQAGVPAIV